MNKIAVIHFVKRWARRSDKHNVAFSSPHLSPLAKQPKLTYSLHEVLIHLHQWVHGSSTGSSSIQEETVWVIRIGMLLNSAKMLQFECLHFGFVSSLCEPYCPSLFLDHILFPHIRFPPLNTCIPQGYSAHQYISIIYYCYYIYKEYKLYT